MTQRKFKEAMQATRKFFVTRVDFDQFSVGTHTSHHGTFKTHEEAQERCDALNFIAVMNLIKDPPADVAIAVSSIYTTIMHQIANSRVVTKL